MVAVGLGVARQDQLTSIGGGQVHVDHLHGRELLQHRPRRESGGARAGALLQRHMQAIGDEGDKDVGFDAFVGLMIDRADREVVFEFFECLLDLGEPDVVLPQGGGVFVGQVGAQQILLYPT